MSLQEQHQQILHAINTQKLTLREYAESVSITYEQAEQLLSDALRWYKKNARWGEVRPIPAQDTNHIQHQGSHFPGLAMDNTKMHGEDE